MYCGNLKGTRHVSEKKTWKGKKKKKKKGQEHERADLDGCSLALALLHTRKPA